MARLNIEDGLWKDYRFLQLIIKLGDLEKAIGAVFRLWTLGQKYYLSENNKMIPASEWEKQNINEALITVGLAERIDNYFRVCGADQHFGWLQKRAESGRAGGCVSAMRNRDSNGRLLPKTDTKHPPSKNQAPTKQKPSAAKPLYSSYNNNKNIAASGEASALWNFYKTQLISKGIEAIKSAKNMAICATLVRRHGIEKSKLLVDAFLSDTDWAASKAWPIGLLISQEQTYLAKCNNKLKNSEVSQKTKFELEQEIALTKKE